MLTQNQEICEQCGLPKPTEEEVWTGKVNKSKNPTGGVIKTLCQSCGQWYTF